MKKIENIVKRAVSYDSARGDEVEVTNLPFETAKPKLNDDTQISENWFSKIMRNKPIVKYFFPAVFLIFSFLFIVRPMVKWLTSGDNDDVELLKQLPMTVGEIENEFNNGMKSLPFRDQAASMIKDENEESMDLMRDWLNEK
jgi:flagellar M-ring protein FliF